MDEIDVEGLLGDASVVVPVTTVTFKGTIKLSVLMQATCYPVGIGGRPRCTASDIIIRRRARAARH